MQYLKQLDDLNPENRTFALNNDKDEIHLFAYSGKTLNNNDEKQKEINLYYGRYFLRKGFNRSIEDLDENVVKPLFVDKNGQDYYPLPQENISDLIYKDKLGIKGFAYSPNATQEQKDIEFEKIVTAFVGASKNLDFKDEKNLFSISHNIYEVNYNNGGNEDFDSSDILNKLRVETPRYKAVKKAQMQKVALKNHIERRKTEIRERLSKTPRDEYGNVEVSGVVKADKHAEMIINDDWDDEYSEDELAMKEWGEWQKERTEELPQAFDNAKKGTIEQKVEFIRFYGSLFDQGDIDESSISKEKYKELNDFVIDTFNNHKEAFYNVNAFYGAVDLLDTTKRHMDQNQDREAIIENRKTVVDLFDYNDYYKEEYISLPRRIEDYEEVLSYAASSQNLSKEVKRECEKLLNDKTNGEKRNFEQHKNRIRARLNNKNKEDFVSGVVVADKIAEGKINGIINEPVTPEKGKKLSDSIKNKIIKDRQFNR